MFIFIYLYIHHACHLLDGWTFFLVHQFVGTPERGPVFYDQLDRYASEYEELQLAVPCRKKSKVTERKVFKMSSSRNLGGKSPKMVCIYIDALLYLFIYFVDRCFFFQKNSLYKWHHLKLPTNIYICFIRKHQLFPAITVSDSTPFCSSGPWRYGWWIGW